MRVFLLLILLTAACTAGRNHLENFVDQDRRGQVELIVKSGFAEIINDIQTGGGDTLTAAFDAAGVPNEERATRAFQLNTDIALYANNPGALVTALMVYSSS